MTRGSRSIFLFQFVVAREEIKRKTVDDDNNNHRAIKQRMNTNWLKERKPKKSKKETRRSSFFNHLLWIISSSPLPNFLLFGYRETRRIIVTPGALLYLFRIFHHPSKFISSSHKLQSLERLASLTASSFSLFSSAKMPRAWNGRAAQRWWNLSRERKRGEGVMFLKDCTARGNEGKMGKKKRKEKRARRRRKAAFPWMGKQPRSRRRLYMRDRVLLSSLRRSPSFPEMRPHERIFDPF